MSIHSNRRVLIADDEPQIREVMSDFLELLGFEVTDTVGDGRMAVSSYLTRHADILLFDYDMPGLNGLEAARLIRLVNPDVKVIICSGSWEKSEEELMASLARVILLQKPATLDEIRLALGRVCHDRIPYSPPLTAL